MASPFKILGALIPNPDPNLSDIQFTSGSAELLASEQNKLNQIAEIMAQKTELNLQLNPSIDNNFDQAGLQLQQLLKTSPFSSFDTEDTETQQWLTAQLPAEELSHYTNEEEVVDHLKILQMLTAKQILSEDSFKTLVEQRNLSIKNYFITNAGIAAEKIFIEQAQAAEDNQAMIKIGVSR